MKITMKMLGIRQKFGCVYHPQSQGAVERANGTLKAKLAKIRADAQYKLNWVDALPLALTSMQTQANRLTHQTLHETLKGRPMPVPCHRGPNETNYLKHLSQIHEAVFQQVIILICIKDF